MSPVAIDFETKAIVGNPIVNPPEPVGVAIWDLTTNMGKKDPEYLPINDDTRIRLWHYWKNCDLVFHNAQFDLAVAKKWLDLDPPAWDKIHDTLFLVYLKNPHANNLGLKHSADTYLELPPEEQDELREWVLANVPKSRPSNWGGYISYAPFELVSKYAKGDVYRTLLLYEALIDEVPTVPYNRERQLAPILATATCRGVPVHRQALEKARDATQQALAQGEQVVRQLLNAPTLNPHSNVELAKALEDADAVSGWDYTDKGNKRVAKASLLKHIKDPKLLAHLNYVSTLSTVIGTFIEPWILYSEDDGRIHPNWNQVRQPNERKGGSKGTRTGRLSSDDPNFQNVIDGSRYQSDLVNLEPIPFMRRFVIPEDGHVWLKRDFSGQEMRILAHYECGKLAKAYRSNPDLDPHQMVKELIKDQVGKDFPRKSIKETGFGMIYGMGASALSGRIGCTMSEARELQDAYKQAIPGVESMQSLTKKRGKENKPIRTWGGRNYYAEEPKIVGGSYRSFEYKLLNYLIQGSGADQTKQCIIDWNKNKEDAVFMATVHDEINISAPKDRAVECMEWLRHCMEQEFFKVPMKSDSFIGKNWADLEEFNY
tara:strand:- start:754 stop:2550 length:1797 start_codon:yes stop_codon:yes gene_type:complete